MAKVIDLSAQRFGKLTVLHFEGRNKHGGAMWKCVCDCGKEQIVSSGNLRSGNSISCGDRHGQMQSLAYMSWKAMKARCYNPNNEKYKDYGARKITVCDRWRYSFLAFLHDMGERPTGLTLDRVDVNGNYEPSNCRWATAAEQNANRRNSKKHRHAA